MRRSERTWPAEAPARLPRGADHNGTVLSRTPVNRSFLVEGSNRPCWPATPWAAGSATLSRRASQAAARGATTSRRSAAAS